ncbi:hypothetical protein [Rubrivirga marina]|uniref:Uncharacterized protein n=1 Tax=Rubrivirga marina TaxID=1196024 RepID=A0A271IXC6_9BACT|nr:hypothetical protein [Rubrivirga marina]PAP75189.1 hypothetical protein BSZ37_01385 [Rubrivirga marina]
MIRHVLALAFLVPPVAAQEPIDEALAAEVLQAVVGTFSPESDMVFVTGRAPDGADRSLLPADAVILGGFATDTEALLPSQSDARTGAIAFGRLPLDPEAAADAYAAALPGGWSLDQRPTPREFQLCWKGGSRSAEVTFSARQAGGSYVTASNYGSRCDPADRPRTHIELPSFAPPPGHVLAGQRLEGYRSAGSGGLDAATIRIETRGPQTVADLTDHLAAVLREDGWARVAEADAGGAVVSTWTRANGEVASVAVRPHEGGLRAVVTAAR